MRKSRATKYLSLKKALYVVPHGLQISAFSEGKYKYYVVGSETFKDTVVAGYEFDSSSREVGTKSEGTNVSILQNDFRKAPGTDGYTAAWF